MDTTALGIETHTLLALAAMFLGLALVVQVVQEIWKYVTSSKARTYRMVLRDSFGPWIEQLYGSGPVARYQVRGPFQWGWLPSSPKGVLLPLSKEDLLEAMDNLASGWMGRTLETLKAEARLQEGTPAAPSPAFARLVAQLEGEAKAGGHHSDARRMREFLEEWGALDAVSSPPSSSGAAATLDAGRVLTGLYQEVFPDRLRAEREFGQLARNFEHANKRRNLRYSFVLGLLVALAFNFPIHELWERSTALSPSEAIALAEEMQELRREVEELEPLPDEGEEEAAAAGEAAEVPPAGTATEPTGGAGDVTGPATGAGPAAAGEGTEEGGGAGEEPGTEPDAAAREAIEKRLSVVERVVLGLDPEGGSDGEAIGLRGFNRLGVIWASPAGWGGALRDTFFYLLGCLVTALFVTFGAPFWDRLVDALLRVQPRSKPTAAAAREEV